MSDHASNIQPMPDPYREAERRAADTRTPSFTDDEMETIRKALLHSASNAARHAYPQGNPNLRVEGYLVRKALLPQHLVPWVLGDPPPAPCAVCGGSGKIEVNFPTAPPTWGMSPCPSCGVEK